MLFRNVMLYSEPRGWNAPLHLITSTLSRLLVDVHAVSCVSDQLRFNRVKPFKDSFLWPIYQKSETCSKWQRRTASHWWCAKPLIILSGAFSFCATTSIMLCMWCCSNNGFAWEKLAPCVSVICCKDFSPRWSTITIVVIFCQLLNQLVHVVQPFMLNHWHRISVFWGICWGLDSTTPLKLCLVLVPGLWRPTWIQLVCPAHPTGTWPGWGLSDSNPSCGFLVVTP